MGKAFWKEILRDIKHSKGTFIAIIAIVALGAGFFGGLKATSVDMKLTADKYYKDYSMMDFRVLSTLGITPNDADALQAVEGVLDVMPSYRIDALIKKDLSDENVPQGDSVIRLHSTSPDAKINRLNLKAGRLPNAVDECVVLDNNKHGQSYAIGDTIKLDFANDKDSSDALTTSEFEVVGMVETPLYMSIEKGTTDKGSGSIGNFAFISEEAFSLEAYTELYVTLAGVSDVLCYSDEYKAASDALKDKLEAIGDERGKIRLAEVKEEPLKELSDAKAEFATKKADAQKEISDAKTKLDDAKNEIDASEEKLNASASMMPPQMLSAARKEIETAKTEYNSALAELEKNQADADEEFAKAQLEIDDAQKEINDIKLPDWYVLDRADAPGHAGFEQDADRVDAVSVVFPVFFFLVAALVCLTTMTRMVEEQRRQVGVLTALGYGKLTILTKYLLYATVTSVIGTILGLAVGFVLFPKAVWMVYGMMYSAPPILTPWNHQFAALAMTMFFVCIIGSTLLACASELICTPADLIRPKPPKNGKRIILENISFLWKRFSFTQKLTARNILRYKKRFFMTVVGIAGCTALMLTGFGLKDSISGIVPSQFGKVFLYDSQIGLTNKLDVNATTATQDELLTELDNNDNISQYQLVHQQSVKAINTKKSSAPKLDAFLYIPEKPEEILSYISLANRTSHQETPIQNEGAVVTEKLAREFSLKIGDDILIEDNDLKTYKVKVTGICENYIQNYIFISPHQYEKIYQEPCSYQVVLANLTEVTPENESAVSTAILGNEEVAGVFFTSELSKTFKETFDRMDIVVLVLTASASLLAFIVLYNLTSINVTERTREIATIKVLGFYNNEVDGYIYRENIVLTIIGILLGFVMGIGLHAFVMKSAEVNMALFVPVIKPLSYLWSALLTIVFSVAVNFVIHFRLKKIDMVESLKSNE